MPTIDDTSDAPHLPLRSQLAALLSEVRPWDALERSHLAAARDWVAGGAPLWRTRKPDVPAMHLVSYFLVLDEAREEVLLAAHRKAGLWLPSGGHVEPDEDPWETVVRECAEELGIEAVPATVRPRKPFFVSVTDTRGPGRHTDVSLWYLLQAEREQITSFDEREFAGITWLRVGQVLEQPIDVLDPHMHRFTRKLIDALGRSESAVPRSA